MHEVGIMEQALELAVETARREGATKIVRLSLRIGALSGVVPDALAFAFDAVSHGTMAEGAAFEWEEVPVVCRCGSGCPDFMPGDSIYVCPACGAVSMEIVQGRELDLTEIEVE